MMQSAAKPVNKWMVLISVAMGVFLATIDGSIVNIGLNTLVNELHQPLALVEWVVLAYMLTIATLMLTVGRLSDMIGKKKLYLAGIIIFTIGSGLCGIAPSVYWLIGFRVLQAVGAVLVMAIGMAIVTENFPPQERGKALGVMGTMVSLGIITGPTLGGLILQSLSWHWLFFVNLPVGLIGVFMVIRFIPNDTTRSQQKFDFAGAGVMFVFMASLLFALSVSQHSGFNNPLVFALLALAIGSLIAFIVIENKSASSHDQFNNVPQQAIFDQSHHRIYGVPVHRRNRAPFSPLPAKYPSLQLPTDRVNAGSHTNLRFHRRAAFRCSFRPDGFTPHHHAGIIDRDHRFYCCQHAF